MRNLRPSRTAEYMALFRAIETTEPPDHRLFEDPYAAQFLSSSLRRVVRLACIPVAARAIRTVLDIGWPYTRSSGVVRTRAIDDLVREAVRNGAQQLVLLGAGFDSRPYRLQEVSGIPVFEVDHPATQQVKLSRLGSLSSGVGANIRFISVNFEVDNLEDRLIASGFHPINQSVVVWEGVVSYLSGEAVHNNLSVLSRLLAPGSQLILTYMHKDALDGSGSFDGARRWKSWVAISGEPFILGFDPQSLAHVLETHGFHLQHDASTRELAETYCPPLGRHEPGSDAYRVAVAARNML